MPRYQICDADVGIAIVEAKTPRDALYAYYADRVKGDLRPIIETGEKHASVTYMGETVEAVPVP